MSAITAIIAARRNKYIRTFRKAGAVSPGNPLRLADAGLRRSMIFDRLVRQRVFVPAGANAFYLDEQKEQELRRKRMPVLIITLVLLLILLLARFFLSR